MQGLLHDALNHLLVALDLELAISHARHVLHHLLLSLNHEFFALLRVHVSHLEVLLLILLHASFERGQIVVNHESIHGELFLGLKLEDSCDGEVERHSTHESLDHVQQNLDQVDLIDQNPLLLRSVDVRGVNSDRKRFQFDWVTQISHVLLKSGWELVQEILVDFLQLLKRDVLEGQGASLNDAAQIILFHIEGEDLHEFEHLHVEVVVVHFEVTRADIDASMLDVSIERKELLQDEKSVLEIRIGDFKTQF